MTKRTQTILQATLDAYAARYPHFEETAAQAARGEAIDTADFARSARRLAVPAGVAAAQVTALDRAATSPRHQPPDTSTSTAEAPIAAPGPVP
jgi:hypothetical protein